MMISPQLPIAPSVSETPSRRSKSEQVATACYVFSLVLWRDGAFMWDSWTLLLKSSKNSGEGPRDCYRELRRILFFLSEEEGRSPERSLFASPHLHAQPQDVEIPVAVTGSAK